ncbi:ImmA/IrrE family metallo-endopeptidase [Rhizobium sp. Root1204]|uniref:ImmA/IrrE family metallo-endopeptidase n=1 Tax=Rhizobium sp. Root1204 TaxID=1736428 RepID=UPI000714D2E1|nr:ImmA/IrrE family metallo-endopeptidase [Rhizobium sp. Root1204]KQV31817.1 hypothetical protein ASC96_31140 [Rhizobium sp. Root1204]
MGIVKYDQSGLEIIADRHGGLSLEHGFIESQIFQSDHPRKSLKFSAFCDGIFFSSFGQLMRSIDPEQPEMEREYASASIPYISDDAIKHSVTDILGEIEYQGGPVDLERICSALSISLNYSDQDIRDIDGIPVLGSANFTRKLITINAHGNRNRERFTLGHEIGHFHLKHGEYLSSETIVEKDLLIKETAQSLNYERLEYQANAFSSNLILPDGVFKRKTAEFRHLLEISDRGHGYVFVDDQPYNSMIYDQLLTSLSNYFEVSKQAVQIKLKNLGMLTDERKRNKRLPATQILDALSLDRK